MAHTEACEFCEGVVEHRQIRTRFHYHSQTIYVENVPAWVCTTCGEQYFDAPVYKRLEEIASRSDQIQETICFPLAEYNTALD
jgi:YgiT-type zinc finger domain-containing protein